MNNDYSFINSSDTSQQLALLDELLSENYEFRHNVLSDVYEIRELGSRHAYYVVSRKTAA